MVQDKQIQDHSFHKRCSKKKKKKVIPCITTMQIKLL